LIGYLRHVRNEFLGEVVTTEARASAGARKASARKKNGRNAPLTVTRPELLVDGSDEQFRSLVHASLAFSSRLTAIRDGYAKLIGVAGPQYTILVSIRYLERHCDVHIKTIAEHLSLSGTFVTTEVNKLISEGLVVKKRDDQDARRVKLQLSNMGIERLAKLSSIQQQVNNVHFGSLSKAQFDELCIIMPELVTSTDQALSLLRHLTLAEGEAA
jgi:DNA-binding MarR family transcriptional regulator